MSNSPAKVAAVPVKQTNIHDTGENSLNIANEAGGHLQINIEKLEYTPVNGRQDCLPFLSASRNELENDYSIPDLRIIKKFSTDYYQLLVTADEEVLNSNIISFDSRRALTKYYVPEEIFERCSSLKLEGQKELKTFPAIICSENTKLYGETDPDQECAFGYIKAISTEYSSVKVVFKPLLTFPQSILNDPVNAVFFNLRTDTPVRELNHSAWYVKQANIFEAFFQAGISGIPSPDERGF